MPKLILTLAWGYEFRQDKDKHGYIECLFAVLKRHFRPNQFHSFLFDLCFLRRMNNATLLYCLWG